VVVTTYNKPINEQIMCVMRKIMGTCDRVTLDKEELGLGGEPRGDLGFHMGKEKRPATGVRGGWGVSGR
jgi:hypothetical protein